MIMSGLIFFTMNFHIQADLFLVALYPKTRYSCNKFDTVMGCL